MGLGEQGGRHAGWGSGGLWFRNGYLVPSSWDATRDVEHKVTILEPSASPSAQVRGPAVIADIAHPDRNPPREHSLKPGWSGAAQCDSENHHRDSIDARKVGTH